MQVAQVVQVTGRFKKPVPGGTLKPWKTLNLNRWNSVCLFSTKLSKMILIGFRFQNTTSDLSIDVLTIYWSLQSLLVRQRQNIFVKSTKKCNLSALLNLRFLYRDQGSWDFFLVTFSGERHLYFTLPKKTFDVNRPHPCKIWGAEISKSSISFIFFVVLLHQKQWFHSYGLCLNAVTLFGRFHQKKSLPLSRNKTFKKSIDD